MNTIHATNRRWFTVWLLATLMALIPTQASAATVKISLDTPVTIPCSLQSITNNSYWGCASISNTTNLYLDEQCFVTWKNGGTVSGTPIITIYAAGSSDGGATYSDGASGTNASQTPTNPVNYRLLAVGNVPVAATQYQIGPFSIASAFGGSLPGSFQLIIQNGSGSTSDSTAGNFAVKCQGIWSTVN
jgi:hypothetical protein